jgi:hypothetical protein
MARSEGANESRVAEQTAQAAPIDGRAHRFGADSTIVLPRGSLHQLFNVGPVPLHTLGIFAATPVATRLPDGQAIDLPWRT